jgi:hypothetical protein
MPFRAARRAPTLMYGGCMCVPSGDRMRESDAWQRRWTVLFAHFCRGARAV